MDLGIGVLLLAGLIGLYTSFMGGANDLANSMGTAVGSGALSLKKALFIASITCFIGALFVGARVTGTISKGIIDTALFAEHPEILVCGMLSAGLAAGIFLNIANWLKLPVSTTHSIVGAVLGFGIIAVGIESIQWGKVVQIISSWFLSPITGAILGFVVFRIVQVRVLYSSTPLFASRRVLPFLVGILFAMICLSLVYKGLKNLHLDMSFRQALLISLCVGTLSMALSRILITTLQSHLHVDPLNIIETCFKYLQVITGGYMAFAFGANDVANGIGPFAAIYSIMKTGSVEMESGVPVFVLVIGGLGLTTGFIVLGYRVIETVGKKITEITPSRGFSAEFATATTVLICSKLGMPVSTTHTLVGAVIGVGLARGITAIDVKIVKNIFMSWFVTLPATGILSAVLFFILRATFF